MLETRLGTAGVGIASVGEMLGRDTLGAVGRMLDSREETTEVALPMGSDGRTEVAVAAGGEMLGTGAPVGTVGRGTGTVTGMLGSRVPAIDEMTETMLDTGRATDVLDACG